MKSVLPIRLALLLLMLGPGVVKGICPGIEVGVETIASVCLGEITQATAWFSEIPGNCNGLSTFPYKRWYWHVEDITASPSSGRGDHAEFTALSAGRGKIVYDLVCRSRACPDCNAEYQAEERFDIIHVDIAQSDLMVCADDTSATLNVTDDSYSPNGFEWTSRPHGITGNGESIPIDPRQLVPRTYEVKARADELPGCFDTCTVSVIKVDIVQTHLLVCHDAATAALNLSADSYSPNGYVWSSTPAGIFGSGPSNTLTFVPSNLPPGHYTVKATSADLADCFDACEVSVLEMDVVGHEPGTLSNPGIEISDTIEDDAQNLQVAVNDDNDDEIEESHQDNQDDEIGDKDNDIVAIMLIPMEPLRQSGTMTLAVYPAENVRIYKSDGTLLNDYDVNLASPQGDLSALVSASVMIFIEGMKPGEDVVLSLTYTDGDVSCSDEVHLQVMQVDLDIDSDNENGLAATGWTDAEDKEEDDETMPGKYIGVNDGDVDRDGIPNFADGYDLWDPGPDAGGSFTPLALELKEPIDLDTAQIKFTYSCSNPEGVERTERGTPVDPYLYTPPVEGHLRLWRANGSANRKMAEVCDGGDFIKTGVEYATQDLDFGPNRTVILYAEGLQSSEQIGDQQILVEVTPDPDRPLRSPDAVRCTLLKAEIVPDWNHDRKITDADCNKATAINPFRFWLNDDKDDGDVADGNSDVPGKSNGNAGDDKVNGRCDLLDFFPVWLNIGKAMKLLPDNYNCAYVLRQANGAVNFFHSKLPRDEAGDYLIEESPSYGWGLTWYASNIPVVTVSAPGVDVDINGTTLSMEIEADPNKGVLILEGKVLTTSPLVLEIRKGGQTGALLYETQLPLSLSGVENMYRWINLRHLTGGAETKHTDTSPPPNFPDTLSNGKHVIFIAGFNNSEDEHRASSAEVFKRLYQSGSRAMFTGVSWEGDEDPGCYNPFQGLFPPETYYHLDAVNAFAIAPNLAQNIAALPSTGGKYVIAHSLGNMVVSSAIKDHGLSVTNYFMLDAAVAIEAYNSAQLSVDEMRPSHWAEYSNHTWAANWHILWNFNTNDARNNLTWLNRFGDIPNAVNYYSSGEEVLANSVPNPPPIPLAPPSSGQNAWTFQEMMKGCIQPALIPCLAGHGGWGFNTLWQIYNEPPNPGLMNSLSDSALRTGPVFKPFYSTNIFGPNGSQFVSDPEVRAKLLGEAIPALSRATGRNEVDNRFGAYANKDMNAEFITPGLTWPQSDGNWKHGDFRGVAYLFNYGLYDDICSPNRGNLQ